MKIRLLFAFIALSFASCSSDDSSTGKDPSENPGDKKLREIIQTEFNDNGSVKQTVKIQFDDKDRALSEFGYDSSGILSSKKEYVYNSADLLETMIAYTVQNDVASPDYSYALTYDSSGRVITRTDSGAMAASTTYAYNANNTITVIRTAGSVAYYATYYVNTAGQLFKKTTETETEQLTYTGANILKYTSSSLTSVFAYDSDHTPKGQQHNVVVNLYKGNMVNALLIEGLDAVDLGSTQYTIQRKDNADVYDYEYQFDNDNYPTKVRCFKNDSSIPFSIREVYYR